MASLTAAERVVLGLVAQGLSNREIGLRLNVAEKTVKNYVTGILAKLGVRGRGDAAGMWVRGGR